MIARMLRGMLLAAGWLLLSGHVGSNNVVLEGRAGGYPVRVVISPPGVVPAQVPIMVRVLEGTPSRVTVQAAQWNLGTKGAPPPEEASTVAGESGVWAHDLWIMTSSTYAVHVAVEGPAGNGTLVVPMQSSATRTLGMDRILTVTLVMLGTLLVVGVLTIVGAAAREGSMPVGEKPTPVHQRKARIVMAFTAGLLGIALLGGAKWWAVEEHAYRRSLFRPVESASSVRAVEGTRVLTTAITDSLWHAGRYSPMMPDHGKMMHLFLVRAGDAGAIAHLHPVRVHADSFTTRVPDLPAGRYLLFADILLQSGAQRTLTDTVDLPAVSASGVVPDTAATLPARTVPALDGDDSWRVVPAVAIGEAASLASGGTLTVRADTAIAAGRDLRLVTTVRNADGSAATLEPYMGMAGHAMVTRVDGGVFVHLHPAGTASMAAQAQLVRRERGDTVRRDSATAVAESVAPAGGSPSVGAHAAHGARGPSGPSGGESDGTLAFPFAFPGPGDYRVFVQVKRAGAVETASFRVVVPETSPRR